MLSTLLVLSVLATGNTAPATPSPEVLTFQSQFPAARLQLSERGHVALATDLAAPAFDADPLESARRFLSLHGAVFGVQATDTLVSRTQVLKGLSGTAVFERTVQGLKVFDGHVAVGLTADGGIHAVTSSGRLPAVGAAFRLTEAQARQAALARLPGGEVTAVDKGWSVSGDPRAPGTQRLRPFYKVSVWTQTPYRAHLFPVDGETGAVGLSLSRLLNATGKVYRVSPSKPFATTTPAEACPKETGEGGRVKVKTCAPVEEVPLLGLDGSGTLTGSSTPRDGRTTIYNCQGKSTYSTLTCPQTMRADGAGNFNPPSTTDFEKNKSDPMSELMAYYHVDKHSRFLDSLDPSFAGLPLIPGFTNAYDPFFVFFGTPMNNAFFDPTEGKQKMVFGQGSTVDFAYDGEVVYHEMTHAACTAIGNGIGKADALFPYASQRGLMMDPLSINEGNADAFAMMAPGVNDPYLGEFDARGDVNMHLGPWITIPISIPVGPGGYVRNVGLDQFRTCQGQASAKNPGRNGEPHEDGEIWGQYAYELFQGLKGLPNGVYPGATYSSPASPAMFQALRMLVASPAEQQTFSAFASLVESQVRAMYGQKAGDYVQCVNRRRDMAGCDGQAVTVYSGEAPVADARGYKAFYLSKADAYQDADVPNFEGVPASHQWKITVPEGATALKVNVCDLSPDLRPGEESSGGTGRLFIQKGKPVDLKVVGTGAQALWSYPVQASWSVDFADCGFLLPKSTEATLRASGCTGCLSDANDGRDALAAGDWYFLVANTGAGPSFASFKATLTAPTVPTRPNNPPESCVLDITPPPPVGGGGGGFGGGGGDSGAGGGSEATPTCTSGNCGSSAEPVSGCGCGTSGATSAVGLAVLLGLGMLRRRRT